MAIPQQVQERADKADELHKSMLEPDATAKPAETPGEEGPAAAEPPATEEPPVTPAEPTETLETLMPKYQALLAQENKFKTLEGMFKKRVQEEVDRQLSDAIRRERILNNDLTERDRKIKALEDELQTLKQKPKTANFKDLFSAEEIENLGDEGISGEAGAMLVEKAMQRMRAETAPVVKKVETVSNESREAKAKNFYDVLGAAVPDWEKINDTMKEWHDYLKQRAPGANYPRQAIIEAAQKALDPLDIINLLKDFKTTHPTLFTETPATPPATPPAKTNMERQVETVQPSTVTPRSATPGRTFTSVEANKILTEIANRKGSGGQADLDLEAEITEAYTQGRVRHI